MTALFQDIRYGLRILLKNPAFTIVAVVTLALGIGANTAMFSAVNAILLRPLPYKDSGRLVDLWGTSANYPGFRMTLSMPEFNDVKAQSHSFENMAAYALREKNWTGHGQPEVVSVTEISQDFFATLGVSFLSPLALPLSISHSHVPTTIHQSWIIFYYYYYYYLFNAMRARASPALSTSLGVYGVRSRSKIARPASLA